MLICILIFKILINFLCIIYFNILVFSKLFLTIKGDFMNKTPDLSQPNAVNIAYIVGTVFAVITCVAVGLLPCARDYVENRIRRARAIANRATQAGGGQRNIDLAPVIAGVNSPGNANEVIITIPVTNHVTNHENPAPSSQPVIVDLGANPNPGPSSANITAQIGISGARI